ncbi:MAG: putative Acyl carrier protein [Deltaproteobacteria bacterium]|nr:putative Acyl carrier protein [Deltaproteobacteria bacterium]
MTAEEITATVLEVLGQIAPEADVTQLRPDVAIRDQLDIDSMDFLNFVIALHERLHIDIPETDYQKVATLSGCVAYLAARAL